MSSIWFTADTHFNHANIIAYCQRPWIKSGEFDIAHKKWSSDEIKTQRIQEHDEALIENWNKLVKSNDIIYHLGDFAFVKKVEQTEEYIRKLNGKIHLIVGNHDKSVVSNATGFSDVTGAYQGKLIKIKDKYIYLHHFAHRVWEMSHYGSYHLYGHTHGDIPEEALSFDVGVDCWDYKPISFEQIIEKMR